MAAVKLQHFHVHPSSPPFPNTQLQSTNSNLSFTNSTCTSLTFQKTHLIYPLILPLSRKCLSSTTTQQEFSLEEEKESVLEQTQKEDLKKKLFVVGLPWSFSASDVKSFFSECGTVTDVEIIKREDGKRGFVFVTMSSGEEAVAVIDRFDSYEVEGRIIKVEYSKTLKKPTPPRSPTVSNETRHKLFVSNLAWKARATNLKEFFADFSPVSTRIVFSASGSSAGYGFVSFATKEEAESAVSTLNGKDLLGRPIILKVLKKLKFLSLIWSKLKTFDFRITPNLETLFLENSNKLKELFMPVCCQKLKSLHISHSKLKTLDLSLCARFVKLQVSAPCPNLKFLELDHSRRLRSLDLELIPNLEMLDLKILANLDV